MRIARLFAWGAVALSATNLGCSSHVSSTAPPRSTMGVTAPQGQPPAPTARQREERAQELIRLADLQIHDLENSRAAANGRGRTAGIDEQIVAVARYRDTVLSSLAEQSPSLQEDMSNLERAMQSAALSTPQVPALRPSQPSQDDMRPGGYTLPPTR
jgi:hypothetical protein